MKEYRLRDLTPKEDMCLSYACPAIYEEREEECLTCACPTIEEHEGKYLIVGKVEDAKKFGLAKKVGEGEILISVPKRLIDNMER